MLLDAEEPKRLMSRRTAIWLLGAGAAAATGGGSCAWRSYREREFQGNILMYAASPRFTNADFAQQATGTPARLALYDADEEMAYFKIPEEHFSEEVLRKLAKDQRRVQVLAPSDNVRDFGALSGRNPGEFYVMFPARDFAVDANRVISVPFGAFEYNATLGELNDLIKNENLYDDMPSVETEDGVILANHGACIATRREPSMQRFLRSYEKWVREDPVRAKLFDENPSQALLAIIHVLIKYDGSDSITGKETVKRPSEVLMTKEADCSGMTVLYASLLEQAGVDYRLAYFFNETTRLWHLSVPVNHRHLPREPVNDLNLTIDGNPYAIAEVTLPRFLIGITEVAEPYGKRIYVQNPKDAPSWLRRRFRRNGQPSTIRNLRTGAFLPTA